MNIDTNVFSNTLNFNLLQNVEFASTILFLLTVSVMILKQSTLLPDMEVTQVRRTSIFERKSDQGNAKNGRHKNSNCGFDLRWVV